MQNIYSIGVGVYPQIGLVGTGRSVIISIKLEELIHTQDTCAKLVVC